MSTHKAIVLHQYTKVPLYQDFPKPVPKPGELLVKVDATTINPSDRLRIGGTYFPVPLPATMGLEGTGHIVEAHGEHIQEWVGKRVSFIQSDSGSWGEYAVTNPHLCFEIDEEVSLTSAASGIVNPLTVVGMTDIYNKTPGKKGIIHTAAASALGRMLNKRCQTLGIPLLNIVRRQEQADLLKAEGATHIIVTQGEWLPDYITLIKDHGFNVFFDALGGGPTLQALISGLLADSWVHVYGVLENKPLEIKMALDLSKGVYITGYLLFVWYNKLPHEEQELIRKEYSSLLRGDLSTKCFKVLKYSEVEEGLELSVSKAAEGKVTLVPQ